MNGMTEVLAAHSPTASFGSFNMNGGGHSRYCSCGQRFDVHYSELAEDESDVKPTLNAKLAAHQADALSAAGFGDVREAGAVALEEAASDFEDNMGVGEFDEWARRDGRRWTHIDDAWEYQGPYMDWLRARATSTRAAITSKENQA